jgi:hypothetical protein
MSAPRRFRMPVLKKITEVVDGEELTMTEQVYVVTVENGGQTYFLKDTTWSFSIDRADGFETIEAAAQATLKAHQFMKPALRKKCVVRPYGGDFVRA